MAMHALGQQLMVEYYGCEAEKLNNVNLVRRVMLDTAAAIGATIVGEVFHPFIPYGVSGVVVIAESHLAIHTWPEYCYAAVDLFICGDEIDPYRGFDMLRKELKAERFEVREFLRGTADSFQIPLRHKSMAV